MNKFNCLLYGEAGAGKTPFCGTLESCEKTSPCLFLDVDHGTLSLESANAKPTVMTIKTWGDVQTVYSQLKAKQWDSLSKTIGKQMEVDVPVKEYKSVVIDSGTELANSLLKSIVADDDRNDGVPDQPAYLRTQLRFATMWRGFRDLPLSCVMTAGIKDQKDDVAGIVRFFPEFSPGLLHDLQRHSDLILFMNVALETEGATKRWVRYIQTQPTQRFVARDRSGKLAPQIRGDKIYWKDLLEKVLA